MKIQPVMLAGGSGTRLWPLSRSTHPKQYLPLLGDSTLLDSTLGRLKGIYENQPVLSPLVICNKESRFFVAEHFRKAGIDGGQIILEPCGRNTAPALTLAALHIMETVGDAVMFVAPSDHLIADILAFYRCSETAIQGALEGHIVTLGISPTHAETETGKPETETGGRNRDSPCLGETGTVHVSHVSTGVRHQETQETGTVHVSHVHVSHVSTGVRHR